MTDLRAAARQALEALDNARGNINQERAYADELEAEIDEAITTLRAALEQPEQEPVAWVYTGVKADGTEHGPHLVWKPEHMDAMSAEKGVVASPLYTHPPRRRWRGLTEEEIDEATFHADKRMNTHLEFARAIEAELKERNHD